MNPYEANRKMSRRVNAVLADSTGNIQNLIESNDAAEACNLELLTLLKSMAVTLRDAKDCIAQDWDANAKALLSANINGALYVAEEYVHLVSEPEAAAS